MYVCVCGCLVNNIWGLVFGFNLKGLKFNLKGLKFLSTKFLIDNAFWGNAATGAAKWVRGGVGLYANMVICVYSQSVCF